MTITQAYQFVNDAQKEILGESAISLSADFSNIVDVGTSLANALGVDAYIKKIANRIGKMLFVDRAYRGALPKVLRDAWEFGSIVGKIQADLMDASENEAWKLVQGGTYDPYVVNLPVVSSRFWNEMATFEIDITLPEDQVKQSFASADEQMRFLNMLETMVNNSMELKIESLVRTCIANAIGGVISEANSAQNIHLLTEYNTLAGTTLSARQALINKGFLQYAVNRILVTKDRLAGYSSLFNVGGKQRHTPRDLVHFIAHTEFATAAKTHLESDTYHNDLVALPLYEEVSYWIGSGTGYALADSTLVAGVVTLPDGDTKKTASVNKPYVIAFMFDHDALGVLQPKRKTTSIYNPKGEYFNQFHKWESRQFNDFNENMVVFTLD